MADPSLENPPSPTPLPKQKLPRWAKILMAIAVLFIIAVVLLCFGLYSWIVPSIQQILQPQSPQAIQQQAKAILTLQPGAPFKVLQAVDILGIKLVRMEYQLAPQSFVWVSGLDHQTVEELFQDKLDPNMIEAMGDSVLKLRDAQHPQTLTIHQLEVLKESSLAVDHQQIPYKHLRIGFSLSDEAKPRQYEGVMGRYQTPKGQEAILISYSKAGLYHPELLKTFLEKVDLQE